MTYIVAEPCIDVKCLDCLDVCPVEGIYETERMVVIDPELCFDCGACRAECSVGAVFLEKYLPPEWNAFAVINAACTDGVKDVEGLVTDYCETHPLPPIEGWREEGKS